MTTKLYCQLSVIHLFLYDFACPPYKTLEGGPVRRTLWKADIMRQGLNNVIPLQTE